jgi:hypothetical protein
VDCQEWGATCIEAVFAGTDKQCRRFIQLHYKAPVDACIVKPGLNGIVESSGQETTDRVGVMVAWAVTNSMQHILVTGGELPNGSLLLDREQESVAQSPPPLMIESRSGTGKVRYYPLLICSLLCGGIRISRRWSFSRDSQDSGVVTARGILRRS